LEARPLGVPFYHAARGCVCFCSCGHDGQRGSVVHHVHSPGSGDRFAPDRHRCAICERLVVTPNFAPVSRAVSPAAMRDAIRASPRVTPRRSRTIPGSNGSFALGSTTRSRTRTRASACVQAGAHVGIDEATRKTKRKLRVAANGRDRFEFRFVKRRFRGRSLHGNRGLEVRVRPDRHGGAEFKAEFLKSWYCGWVSISSGDTRSRSVTASRPR
jgi:hypothetical protein